MNIWLRAFSTILFHSLSTEYFIHLNSTKAHRGYKNLGVCSPGVYWIHAKVEQSRWYFNNSNLMSGYWKDWLRSFCNNFGGQSLN